MPRRRKIPRSAWRSSNLSPYDEDLALPAHIRHKGRRREQGSQSPPTVASSAPEDADAEIKDIGDVEDDAVEVQGQAGPSQQMHADEPSRVQPDMNISDAETGSASGSGDSKMREAPRNLVDRLVPPPPLRPARLILPASPSLKSLDVDLAQDEGRPAVFGYQRKESSLTWPAIHQGSHSGRPVVNPNQPLSLAQKHPLVPKGHFQVELYKICSILRKIVQVDSESFAVVDPHDFLEVLSWGHLEPEDHDRLGVIIRLRYHILATRLLIPFFWNGRILLGFIDMEELRIRLFNPVWGWKAEDMSTAGQDHPVKLLRQFVDCVWPDEDVYAWEGMPNVQRTVVRRVSLDPRIIEDYSGNEASEIEHVLPMFIEALTLVSQVPWLSGNALDREPDPNVLKRLLARFERKRMTMSDVLEELRTKSMQNIKGHCQGQILNSLRHTKAKISKAIHRDGPDRVVSAKWQGRFDLRGATERARGAYLSLAEQHGRLSLIVQSMRTLVLKARGSALNDCIAWTIDEAEDPFHIAPEETKAGISLHMAAIHQLADLEETLKGMCKELETWREQQSLFIGNL